MPPKPDKPKGEVQSVRRALRVLEAVGKSGEASVSDLAEELGLAISTTHNILRTLVNHGYLARISGRYRLGPAVTVLSSQWDPVQSLAVLARPNLAVVSERTGQAAVASVLVGSEVCLVAYTPGTGPVTTSPGWTRDSPMNLATGRVLVAMTRESEWPEFAASATDIAPKRPANEWLGELATVFRSGVCVKQAPNAEGTVSVAVPVWARGGTVICSIGSSTPGYFATDELIRRMLDALWDATVKLSSEFGCDALPLPKPDVPHTAILRAP